MKLSELLDETSVLLGLEVTDKWAALARIVDHLVAGGHLPEGLAGEALRALEERERSMSTGMEHGVAVPHAAIAELEVETACLVVVPSGIPFETLSGEDAQILVCLLMPRARKLLHVRTLAEVARLLQRAEMRESLLAAESPSEVCALIRRGEDEGVEVA